MAAKNYRFGIRARLTVIFTLLLAAVSATQFLIFNSQQYQVVDRLMDLNRQINETILHIDNQLKNRAISPDGNRGPDILTTPVVAAEFRQFLDFVEGNLGRTLSGASPADELISRIERLRSFADQASMAAGGGSSFFSVTVSVMDEMSRRSPAWSYTISSRPLLPSADGVLQLSIPVVEQGQVRFVHMQYELSDFIEQFRRSRRTSLLIALASLAVGLVLTLVYSGHFTRPILHLSEAFSRVESGDLDCRVESNRKDEIGQLVGGFNHMLERLKQNKAMEQTIYRQERLSSLGKLAAGIAHEIKNPLNAISLSLQHLGDKLRFKGEEDRELYNRYSNNLQGEVARLSKIVDTFLNFSRMSGLERAPVDINGLIGDVLTLLASDIQGRGVRLETSYKSPTLVREIDPEKMKTVMLNLVINAVEAMPSGGRLQISTSGTEGGPSEIGISDTGCGIEQENIEHVFDLYYSTKESGSGLGLAIVNDIIRDHGGRIEVTSSLGTGSEFRIILP
jgi:signal transduction histidine kinase